MFSILVYILVYTIHILVRFRFGQFLYIWLWVFLYFWWNLSCEIFNILVWPILSFIWQLSIVRKKSRHTASKTSKTFWLDVINFTWYNFYQREGEINFDKSFLQDRNGTKIFTKVPVSISLPSNPPFAGMSMFRIFCKAEYFINTNLLSVFS